MVDQINSSQFIELIKKQKFKKFINIFFGCRVNASESNQISQILLNHRLSQITEESTQTPDLIIINTCSITQKGQNESLRKIRSLRLLFSKAFIFIFGCADTSPLKLQKNIFVLSNSEKNKLLLDNQTSYTPNIKDRLSKYHRYLLNIQTGCNQFCSYCIVPFKRQQFWSMPIDEAVKQTKKAVKLGYTEIIITGINLDKYSFGITNLLQSLLKNTKVKLISFGSIPINCISNDFVNMYNLFPDRLKHFLHIPIQSGSDKILKLMNRPYTKQKIQETFALLQTSVIQPLQFGTDIIVGFPGESDADFKETYNICKQIGFSKIHTFRYSPRPGTKSSLLSKTVSNFTKKKRSTIIRQLSI